MPTFSQDYAPLPGSIEAAAQHARTVVGDQQPNQPDRVDDAEQIVRAMFAAALTRTGPGGTLSLITMVNPTHIRFELRDPNTSISGAQTDWDAHRLISALSDRYGSGGTKDGHMAWAELYVRQAAPV